MVTKNSEYLSNSLTYVYKSEIGERVNYTALTGMTEMSVANSNLDGTGTIYTVLTSASTDGTLIKNITLKGIATQTKGMVRLYIQPDGGSNDLVAEIEIPARSQASIQETFAISIDVDFMLEYEYKLNASMENGSENMVIIAEGLDIAFP